MRLVVFSTASFASPLNLILSSSRYTYTEGRARTADGTCTTAEGGGASVSVTCAVFAFSNAETPTCPSTRESVAPPKDFASVNILYIEEIGKSQIWKQASSYQLVDISSGGSGNMAQKSGPKLIEASTLLL